MTKTNQRTYYRKIQRRITLQNNRLNGFLYNSTKISIEINKTSTVIGKIPDTTIEYDDCQRNSVPVD